MGRLNRAEIIGNLGRDPEIRSFPDGDEVLSAREPSALFGRSPHSEG